MSTDAALPTPVPALPDDGGHQQEGDGNDGGEYYTSDEDEWTRPIQGEAPTTNAGSAAVVFHEEDETERELAGDAVPVVFVAAGTGAIIASSTFRMGHAVESLKGFLEKSFPGGEYPYNRVSLFLGGKMMLDPLSLNDVEGIVPKAENQVEVRIA